MSRVSALNRLQDIDLALDRTRAALQRIQEQLDDQRALQDLRQELAAAATKLQEARTAHKNADHAAGMQRAKIEETDKKLYGGAIKNPKELEDLQQEGEALRRYLVTLEDQLLDCMVALEEAELLHTEAQQAVSDAEQDRSQLEQELDEERAHQLTEVERLETQRDASLASVADDDLLLYQKLRDSKGGQAVSLMEEGCCSTCGMSIPPAKQQTVRGMAEPVICSQCGRILYPG